MSQTFYAMRPQCKAPEYGVRVVVPAGACLLDAQRVAILQAANGPSTRRQKQARLTKLGYADPSSLGHAQVDGGRPGGW